MRVWHVCRWMEGVSVPLPCLLHLIQRSRRRAHTHGAAEPLSPLCLQVEARQSGHARGASGGLHVCRSGVGGRVRPSQGLAVGLPYRRHASAVMY